MKKLFYVFAIVFMVSLVPACSFEQDIDDLTVELPESENTDHEEEERGTPN
ncbi:MAG: hypothetical protein NXI20_16190 [bacterium]|nr:hypothetical protein [bacterium]